MGGINLGRLSKYKTNVIPYLEDIKKWRKSGMSEEQISLKLGISYPTLKEYKRKHISFSSVLAIGKEKLVEELEKSLYKSAKGYFVIEEIEEVEEYRGEIKAKTKKHRKWIPPAVGSLLFALKNLEPKKWRDIQEGTEESKREIVLNLSGLPVKMYEPKENNE